MTTTLYGISNCDTVRKARKWLTAHDIPHRFHDFRKEGLEQSVVETWVRELGIDVVLNRRSTSWRSLSDEERQAALDQSRAVALMVQQPTLIKRPVLVTDSDYHCGYSESAYQQIFGDDTAD